MIFSTPEQIILLAVILLAGYLLGYATAPSAAKWKRKLHRQAERFTAYHEDAEDRVRAAKDRAAALEAEAKALRADRAEAEHTIDALKAAAVARPVLAPAEPEVTVPAKPDEAHDHVEPDVAPAESAVPVAQPVALRAARPAFSLFPVLQEEREPVAEPEQPAEAKEPLAEFPMTPAPTDGEPAPIGPAEPPAPTTSWFGSSHRDTLTRVRSIDEALNTRLFGLGVLRFEDIEKLSAEDEMALEQRLALPVGTIARDQWRAQAALLRAGNDAEHAERFGAAETPVA